MLRSRPPDRPALVPALVVLLGVALLSDGAPPRSLAAIALLGAAGAAAPLRPALKRAFLLLAVGALGGASGAWTCERAALRGAGWLPADGSVLEIDLVGTVLRAPERDRRGESWLRVAVRPARDPRPGAPPALARLVVRASEEPSVVGALRRGDRVRIYARVRAARGGPGARDEGLARLAWGLDASGSVKSPRLVERLAEGDPGPLRLLDLLLAEARSRLDRSLGPQDEARHAAAAMLLGDRAGMDPVTLRALRESGLFHLLAISGLNVALIVGAVFGVLRRLPLPRWIVVALATPALWAFGTLVGADPPVTRACAGTALALLGRALGRDGDPLNTLAVVVALLALAEPPWVFHPGFQLTFAASAALVAATRPVAAAIPAPRPVALALGASAVAYAATAPILAWHFGRLAPVGLVSNLVAGPLCGAILGCGGAVLATADLPVAGAWAAWALRESVEALDAVARTAASAPCASIRVAQPSPGSVLAVAALLVAAWSLSRGRRGGGARGRWCRAAAAAGVFSLHLGPPPRAPYAAEVAVIDVGQGQAVALRGSDGRCLLLDGGGGGGGRFDSGERIVAPWLAAWNCRRLEAVVVSHAHDDHIGGLDSILREFDVGSVWLAAGAWRDDAARRLSAIAHERKVPIALAVPREKVRVGDFDVDVLHPAASDAGLAINDRCAVVRVTARGGASLLVPGDLESVGEGRILARGTEPAADALIAGHHGAAGSSGDEWLAAVGARVAVVSAGEGNRFGHPSPETLERLRRHGAVTLRTDRVGTVVLREEAGGWRVADGPLRARRGTARE